MLFGFVLFILPTFILAQNASCPSVLAPNYGSSSMGRTQMLLAMADECRYDKLLRPQTIDDKPIVISAHVRVNSLGAKDGDSIAQQFFVNLMVRLRWVDGRLSYSAIAPEVIHVTSEKELRDKIWVPKIYMVNQQESVVLGAAPQDSILTVFPDGTVIFVSRLQVSLFCASALAKFPFDQQKCSMVFESWNYNSSQLLLAWESQEAVLINEEIHLSQFRISNMFPNYTMSRSALSRTSGPTTGYFGRFVGNYSSLTVKFNLVRETGHYIMDFYVPSVLVVVVSWVTFWLDPNAVPGRVTLGTSTLLSFITLTRSTGNTMPKVSSVVASEVWFVICTTFIFGSLVEFAFVNTIWRRMENVELKKATPKYILKSTLTPILKRTSVDVGHPEFHQRGSHKHDVHGSNYTRNSLSVVSTSSGPSDERTASIDGILGDILEVDVDAGPQAPQLTPMSAHEIAQWIDDKSKIFFPVAFLLFNILYWAFVSF